MDIYLSVTSEGINANNIFYTDSNDLFEIQRSAEYNMNPTLYPVTSKISIKDFTSDSAMSIYVPFTQGGFLYNTN